MKYRVVLKNGKYIAQAKGHIIWNDLFCGNMSDLPQEFDTAEEAERKIIEFHAARNAGPVVVKQFELGR